MEGTGDAFVGRSGPLAVLAGLAEGPGPAAVVVGGPAGIGKSRLVEEVAARAAAQGRPVAVGRSWPDGDGPPLWPWFEVLAALGCDREVLAGSAAERGLRFARAIQALAAVTPPPVVVLDDLHRADLETLLLARLVVRAAGGWRGLVVATRRPGPTGDDQCDALLAEIERQATPLALDGLDPEEVALLVRAADPAATDDLVATAADLTAGNPLHLRVVLATAGDGSDLATRLDTLVRRNLAAVSAEAAAVVVAAAIVGGTAVPAELAAAAGGPVDSAAVDEAVASRLVVRRDDDVVVAHDAVRRVAAATTSRADRAGAHARLARHLRGGTTADRGRGAQHGLAAAELVGGDPGPAVAAARRAAADLARGPSLVAAATLLDRAIATTRAAGEAPPPTLLVERAETILAGGRLADARRAFEEAAAEAGRAGDAVARARAALGLGGLWLGEHRHRADAERVRRLQVEARAALPEEEDVLRARLDLRLAAEDAYRQGRTDGLPARLAAVRATGDRRALVEALTLVHHATLHPGRERERLALADEQLAVATAVGDEMSVLVALVWRAVDRFLLGDPDAGHSLAELAGRADAVQCEAVVYIARVMEVMQLLRAGRVDEAEAEAAACLALGTRVGDADAVGYYGVHLLAIRMWQAREAEVLDVFESVARSPEHPRGDLSVLAACAVLAARAGRTDRATALLRECTGHGLGAIPRSTTWLTAIAALAEAASLLGALDVAEEAHALLLPHADRPLMPSFAVACFGPVHRTLGTTALACGRPDDAVAHLRAAVDAAERVGDVPGRLQCRADLALALVATGDPAAARRHLGVAVTGARALGLHALAARWAAAAPAALWAPGPAVVRTEGGAWEVRVGDDLIALPDMVGCSYLGQLLARPGQEVTALRLAMHGDGPRGRQGVIDGRALAELRGRVDDLRAEIDRAEQAGDHPGVARRREELDGIARHLATSLGLGGRVRSFDDLPERARTSVQKAIRRTIDRIEADDPLLADHLRRHVRTGLACTYEA